MVEYNTIILGAGISGISCAIYLKRAGIKTLVIEKSAPGGQLNKIDTIENYPGYVSVGGFELASNLMEQMDRYDVDIICDDVLKIDYDKKVVYLKERYYSYQNLVFATGRRERMLGLENEESLIGKGLSFCATCDGTLYREQDVVVVGGANSAVSEAIYLSNICRKVYLIYRKENLRAEDILQKRLKECSNVEIIYRSNVSKYLISDGKVCGVKLSNDCEIKASCVFLAIGHLPNSELFIGDKDNGYIVVDTNCKTSINNVYACGDVIKKEIYQLVTASSDGTVVAMSIIHNNEMSN